MGSDPQVLDIIDVPVLHAQPTEYQKENWLLDPAYYWTKVRRGYCGDLATLTDPVGQLWTNGTARYNGLNDRMPPLRQAQVVHCASSVWGAWEVSVLSARPSIRQ